MPSRDRSGQNVKEEDDSQWVNEPLDDDVCCLDNDNERPRLRLSDDQVWQEIIKIAGVTCSSDFQKIDKTKQRELTDQREQRHACMTFVESRRKSIESSVRPVARVVFEENTGLTNVEPVDYIIETILQ
jgi:hypothetical protein